MQVIVHGCHHVCQRDHSPLVCPPHTGAQMRVDGTISDTICNSALLQVSVTAGSLMY